MKSILALVIIAGIILAIIITSAIIAVVIEWIHDGPNRHIRKAVINEVALIPKERRTLADGSLTPETQAAIKRGIENACTDWDMKLTKREKRQALKEITALLESAYKE